MDTTAGTPLPAPNTAPPVTLNPNPANQADYNAASITVLEGLEAVRKRPGMYIGDTVFRGPAPPGLRGGRQLGRRGARRLRHPGRRHHSRRQLHHRADDGRGIPVGPHPTVPDMDTLDVVMTKLHAGGKFENSAYKVSGGLHGVGVSCVNALSELLQVEVQRNGKVYQQRYVRGVPQGQVKEIGVTDKRGTKVQFLP
jgi:DNA gyrase subunit B